MTTALSNKLWQTADDGCILDWARANPLHWASTVLEAWDDNRLQSLMPFVTSHYWSDRHSINVFSVTGTAHPDYIGLTWQEFLEQGKRMPVNRGLLQSNPGYYHQTAIRHPSMLYVSLDGKRWYVNGDGNHRTCLARFHFERLNAQGHPSQTMIHGVHVDDYRVDWALLTVFQRLLALMNQRKAGRIEGHRKLVARFDGPAWKHDVFEVSIRYLPAKGGEVFLDSDAATKLLQEMEHGRGIRRWLGL